MKLLSILTGVSFLCDVLSILSRHWQINNLFGSAYRLAEFGFLFLIYYLVLNKPKSRVFFLMTAVLFLIFYVMDFFWIHQGKIISYLDTFSALIFMVLSILFFFKLMKDLPTLEVYRLPMFWINIAVLVYFSGNLFLFAFSSYLVEVLKDNLVVYWSFHNLLNITKNLLFAVGLWQHLRTPKLL